MNSNSTTEYDDIRANWLSKRQRAAAGANASTAAVTSTALNNNNFLSTSKLSVNLDHHHHQHHYSSVDETQRQASDNIDDGKGADDKYQHNSNSSAGTRPRRVFRLRHNLTVDDNNNDENKIEFFDDEIDSSVIKPHSEHAAAPPTSTLLNNTPPFTQSSASSNSGGDDDDDEPDKMNIDCQHRQQLHAKAVKSRRGTYSIVFTPAAPAKSIHENDDEGILLSHSKANSENTPPSSSTAENSSSNATSRDDEASDNHSEHDEPVTAVRMRYKNGDNAMKYSNHRHSTANIYLEHLNEVNNKPRVHVTDRLQQRHTQSGSTNSYAMQRHLTCSTFKNVLAKFQTVDNQQQSQQRSDSSRNNLSRYQQHYSSTLSIPTTYQHSTSSSRASNYNKWKPQKTASSNTMGNAPATSYAHMDAPQQQQPQNGHTSAANYTRMRSSQHLNADDSLYSQPHTPVSKTQSSGQNSIHERDVSRGHSPKVQSTAIVDGVRLRVKPQQNGNQSRQAPPPAHWRHSTSTLSTAIRKFEKLNAASVDANNKTEQLFAKTRPSAGSMVLNGDSKRNDTTNGHYRPETHQKRELPERNGEINGHLSNNDNDNSFRRRSSIPNDRVLEKVSRFEALTEHEQPIEPENNNHTNTTGATTSDTQTPTPPPPPTRRRSSVNAVPNNIESRTNVEQRQHDGSNAGKQTQYNEERVKKTAPTIKTATNLVKDRLKQFESNSKLPHEPSLYQQTLKKNDRISQSNANLSLSKQQQQERPASSSQNFATDKTLQTDAQSANSSTSSKQHVTATDQHTTHHGEVVASKSTRSRSSTTPTDSRLSAPLSRPSSSSFGGDDEDGEEIAATPPPSDELGQSSAAAGSGGRRSATSNAKPAEKSHTEPVIETVPAFIVATRRGTFGAPAKFVQRKSIQQEVILPKCKTFQSSQLEEMVDLARELVAIAPVEERNRFVYVARIERPACQSNGGGVGLVLSTENTKVLISKVISHSLAHRQTTIESGDRLLVINGTLIDIDMHHREALHILKAPRTEVVLVLQRNKDEPLPILTTTDEAEQEKVMPPAENLNGLKVVHLIAEEEGFGFSVDGGRSPSNIGNSKPIVIRRIYANSPAERSDKMHVGDEIVEIDGQPCTNMTKFHAWDLLKSFQLGQQVGMKIRPPQQRTNSPIDYNDSTEVKE